MSKNSYEPHIGRCYGMDVLPVRQGDTWIEGEMMCTDYGQFRRRGLVRHSVSGELVRVRCDIPDTYFSIPATTATEHGYVTGTETGFEFRPHADQTESPVQYRAGVRKAYR